MRTLEEIAASPLSGDAIALRNGRVRYAVIGTMIIAANERLVVADREEVLRVEPWVRASKVTLSPQGWSDLVLWGASAPVDLESPVAPVRREKLYDSEDRRRDTKDFDPPG